MRKLCSTLAAIFIGSFLYATHFVGGDIHYEYLGDDMYKIIMEVYRDCGTSSTDFDFVADVGVFNNGDLIMTIGLNLNNAETQFLDINTGDPCLNPPDDLCVAEAIYEETVEIPYMEGGFTLTYQRCCRNTTLLNCESNDDIGITLTTQIPDLQIYGENSSPDFINVPPIVICLNEPFVFDHSASDLDGDSLAYKFCNPLLTNVPGFEINTPGAPPYPLLEFYPEYDFEYPIDSDPAFAIDVETGLLTGTPTQFGQFVVGICVEEFRDGELLSTTNRDFQFNIVLCSQSIFADIPDEEPCQGFSIDFGNTSNGELFLWDFGIEGSSSDTSSLFEPTFQYADSGSYLVTLIVNPGFQCADTAYLDLSVYEPFEADFIQEDTFCENGIRSFDFISLGDYTSNAEYNWTFEGGTPANSSDSDPGWIAYAGPGTYTVELSVTDHSCTDVVLLDVVVDPTPLAAMQEQTEFCEGLTVDFFNLSDYSTEWVWDFGEVGINDISLEENPSWTYSDYGTYQVLLFADPETQCEDSDTLWFVVLPPDPIEFDMDVAAPDICDTTNLVYLNFTGTGANQLIWDMGDGNTVEGAPTSYVYDDPGLYTVSLTATNTYCNYDEEESIDVFYGVQPIDRAVKVPNVFSPNNDLKNDRYRIFYSGESDIPDLYPPGYNIFDFMEHYQMQIYDRWGMLMFDTSSGVLYWDGLINNELVSEGTYYYIVSYQRKCLDETIQTESGPVSVLFKKTN